MITCQRCDERYEAGTYYLHAEVCQPKRNGRQGPPRTAPRESVREMAAAGISQSEIARRLGLSRQRVHQLIHEQPNGRRYLADEWNFRERLERVRR